MSDKELAKKGGGFLFTKVEPEDIFTPEDLDEMHLMVKKTCEDFGLNKIYPQTDEIEEKNEEVILGLLREAGELGLTGVDIPEEYGGDDADKMTSVLVTEALTYSGSFSTSFGAHTGIGSMPIIYFGNKDQKERYLPQLATVEKIAAYALTEPEAGSDAMNSKTTAVLSDDGKYYILNGAKQYITNAAWADIIIVYAKVDGEHFTAFIVEKGDGVTIDPEEKKMGIKGSSTCSVILEDCYVPVENVLGEVGKGHHIAFNILNIGRYKLAAGALGGSKKALAVSIDYALQREQFKQPIAQFALIKGKVADMVIKSYAIESMLYRTAGLLEDRMSEVDMNEEGANQKVRDAIREFTIECSMNKVYGSEGMDFVVDEAVQIHGGYGYDEEYPVERMYRDSRINRIFEGTNEVNRMLVPGTLLPKGMKGDLPFMDAVFGLKDELEKIKEQSVPTESPDKEEFIVDCMKKLVLLAMGNAGRKFEQEIEKEQEILATLADMSMEVFAAESALLRAQKIKANSGEEAAKFPMMMTQILVSEMVPKLQAWAKEIIAATFDAEKAAKTEASIDLLCRTHPLNIYGLKREIAEEAYNERGYFMERR